MQVAQACHAAFRLSYHCPMHLHKWMREGHESLVVLAVPNERELVRMRERLMVGPAACEVISVTEPDLDYQLTAIAITPNDWSWRVLSHLKLALSAPIRLVQAGNDESEKL